MLDYYINEIFEALEKISLMSDEEFKNTKLGFNLKRNKHGDISITVKQ